MKSLLLRFLDRFFRREEINGGERCPTYLYRWTLFRLPWFKVYLHRFVADDWSMDLHDHPKRFVSIGLAGGYHEWTPKKYRTYRAPWIRTFSAEHIHRICLGEFLECWTLVIVFKTVREWGFWHEGRWIQWREYVNSQVADEMKACP